MFLGGNDLVDFPHLRRGLWDHSFKEIHSILQTGSH